MNALLSFRSHVRCVLFKGKTGAVPKNWFSEWWSFWNSSNFHNWPNIKILLQQQHVACVGNRKMAIWRSLLCANFAGVTLWSLPHWLMGNLLLPRRLGVVTVTWYNSHHVHYQSHCQMLQPNWTSVLILFCNFIFWTFKTVCISIHISLCGSICGHAIWLLWHFMITWMFYMAIFICWNAGSLPSKVTYLIFVWPTLTLAWPR